MPSSTFALCVRAVVNRVISVTAAARETRARRALEAELRDPDLDIWPDKYNWELRSDPVAVPKRAPHRVPRAVRRVLPGGAAARRLLAKRAAAGLVVPTICLRNMATGRTIDRCRCASRQIRAS